MKNIETKQKTLGRAGSISGTGLHTGKSATITLKPALCGAGIRFFKNGKAISVFSEEPATASESLRRTSVGSRELEVQTVEHLLSAISGLGVSNVEIHADGPEMPGLDGSAAGYVKFLKELGIVEQEAASLPYRIQEPIFCQEKEKAIAVYPADEFRVSYVLDYDHPFLKNQEVDFKLTPEIFEKEVAPARTFCTEQEAEAVRKTGLGLGANFENTLVIGKDGPLHNRLRFQDECARHKALDIVGDLALLGFPIAGHVVGIRSGHSLNRKLVEQIKKQRETMTAHSSKTTLNIEQIKEILPHRYPFLLVDRVLEMTGTTAVGLKNVTANEPFFQGHFPQRPVMPGVLMIEALAQLGGILMLSKSENRGKIAYLASVTNARFRRVVVPGDQLRLEIEIVRLKSKIGLMKGSAKVGSEEVCDVEIMFSLAEQ